MNELSPKVRRALISVSDKLGLADFAHGLEKLGIKIYSTGGTARHLEENGLEVLSVAELTDFPEMMDGRVKTLHPRVFGGILCRHDRNQDLESLQSAGGVPFELIVVNLYPFEATVEREETTWDEAIEQIDIGGPSLIRAAAKNHTFSTIVTRSEQYSQVLDQLVQNGSTTPKLRRQLAEEAFVRTATYDAAIVRYFQSQSEESDFPQNITITLQKKSTLRYGENPHQPAALYANPSVRSASLLSARQLNGKELSYNNLLDLDAALLAARSFSEPAAIVIKHTNPCGAAVAAELDDAMRCALDGDPVSAFGSIIGLNRTLDAATAEILCEPGRFIEAIVAPDYEAAAIDLLTTKPKWKNNVRLMQVEHLCETSSQIALRQLEGGFLAQAADTRSDPASQFDCVTDGVPPESLNEELDFAWEIVRHLKSNAIAVCRNQSLCGAGAGQMSRVDAVEIALKKAGDRAQGSVLSSDAFFPFPDSIVRAAKAGVVGVIQPGGSRKDEDVIAACNELGVAMWFTHHRHFRH